MFSPATKTQAKLRITLDGPAGSGKTYSSLLLAKVLGGKTALIDTEHGSASKYADRFAFDTVSLKEFSLDTYLKTIAAAAAAKYEVLIVDSLSHAWTGRGGALEQVDRLGTGGSNNKFTNGWKVVTPLQNQLIDAIVAFPGHVICTLRTKMEYIIEEDSRGKKVPRKVGMAPVQREGLEYEFDVVADLDISGNVTITKTRCSDLAGNAGLLKLADIESVGAKLKAWLMDGVAPSPVVVPDVPVNGHAPIDWDAGGAPQSPRAKVEVALAEATSKAELDAVVPEIKKLSKADQEFVRPLFGKRLAEVKNAPANG